MKKKFILTKKIFFLGKNDGSGKSIFMRLSYRVGCEKVCSERRFGRSQAERYFFGLLRVF